MDLASRIGIAAVFVWLGMVLAISFLEAPLKFRAPGISRQLGLGIGRLVFRALNVCELLLAVVAAVTLFAHETSTAATVALTAAGGALVVQTAILRPLLSRRTALVLAGDDGGRSVAHVLYVGLEVVKVVALIAAGVLLLGG